MNFKSVLSILLCLFIGFPAFSQIFINEFMASNTQTYADPNGEFDDWVELYNAGAAPVNIGGMYITDNLATPTSYQIPNTNPAATTIPAGGYLILWFDNQTTQGETHVVPKLGSSGEAIGLYQSNGVTPVDTLTFGVQYADISFGSTTDGGTVKNFFGTPTPNASNNGSISGLPSTSDPVFSVTGGFKTAAVTVSLSTSTSGASIYYTLNGTPPTTSSTLYTTPLTISTTKTLRAIAVAPPLLASNIISNTYLFNTNHTFPVVTMSIDPVTMFDPATGLYPNYEQDIAAPCNVEMYENDGSLAFNQLLETEIQGTASAALPQKSLALKAKSSLGSATINYPIYDDLPYTQYRSLNLRNSGQDWNITMFRDALGNSIVHDLSDMNGIIGKPKLHTSDYRPSVLYINGEYWGIHNIRERADWRYLKVHFDLDEDEVDIISEEDVVEEGDITEWDNFQNYLSTNSFTSASQLTALSQKVDIEEYMDYIVFNLYIDNTDWPSNNNRRWRERTPGSKWHWFIKDLDFSFGLFQLSGGWNTGDATQNSLARLFNSSGYSWPNAAWSTLLFRKLIENQTWKRDFINRMADQMNTLYQPTRINNRISEFQTTYQPEMQQHFNKWNGGWAGNWIPNINKMRSFANNRLTNMYTHFDTQFTDITGTCTVNVNTNPADKGTIEFSTLHLTDAVLPWSGVYFRGNPIPVNAIPNRGYVFTSWTPASIGPNASTTFTPNAASFDLVANFSQGSTSTSPITINEINYNSLEGSSSGDWVELYNPNSVNVNISGWYLQDNSGGYFSFPANTVMTPGSYLVIVEDGANFNSIFPNITYTGEFGTGLFSYQLSGSGEPLALYNANQILIDTVNYDDTAPWPTTPDGTGKTLQLIAPDLNNALASSWAGWNPTPKALNSAQTVLLTQTISFPAITDKLSNNPPITLNASASSGLPVSYTIVGGPATVNGNTLTLTGSIGTVTVQATQGGNILYQPATPVNISFNVIAAPTATYCNLTGNNPSQQWINNVTIGTINNTSGINNYGNFTSQFTQLQAGASNAISLTAGFSPTSTYNTYWQVWIDYNKNGVFDNPAEKAFQGIKTAPATGTTTATLTGNITIPVTALNGATRMRVTMRRNSYAPVCGAFTYGEVEDYTVIISGGGSSPAVLTLSCPASISVTAAPGVTTAIVNYNPPIASTTCTTTGTNVSLLNGLSSGAAFPIGTTTVTYQATDNCGNTKTCAFTVTVISNIPAGNYCASSASAPWQQWISGVSTGTIQNASGKSNYSNFTNLNTSYLSGLSYNISLTTGFSWQTYNSYWKVWIDYNRNNIFEEPSEVVIQYLKTPPPNGTLSTSVTLPINVPANIGNGATRMRVSLRRDAYAQPCGTYEFGEVEDYTINLVSGWELVAAEDGTPELVDENGIQQLDKISEKPEIYPNPVTDYLYLSVNATSQKEAHWVIYDITGRMLNQQQIELQKGGNIFEIPVTGLPAGVYFLSWTDNAGNSKPVVLKFVKQE